MMSSLQSLLLSGLLFALSAEAQNGFNITTSLGNPSGVQACGSVTLQWTNNYSTTGNTTDSITHIDDTFVGIFATNIGVTQPNGQSVSPYSVNITSTPTPLNQTSITWSPVKLAPNVNYVVYLFSLPGHPGGLDISAHTSPFEVQNSSNLTCLAGINTSVGRATATTFTSTATLSGNSRATTASSTTPAPNPVVTTSGSSTFTVTPSATTSRSSASARTALDKAVILGVVVAGLLLLTMS